MRIFDLSPLFQSAAGFGYLADLLDAVARLALPANWLPYNIETPGENARAA